MKLWITRNSAFSVQCGGLERLLVWSEKPVYILKKLEKEEDDPFSLAFRVDHGLYRKYGWTAFRSFPTSFGKVFGYDDGDNKEFAIIVWQKLCEHFLNEEFEKWDILEKDGKCKSEDFLLEVDIAPIKVESIKLI